MTQAESAARQPDAEMPPYVRALLSPHAYAHSADDIRVHETHNSWVVLAGAYAYKIKKPVNLGFLDFSTPAQRAAACANEVRLNRRLSPDIYLGIVDLVEREGSYFVGGPGRPVEPAVWMRRLPEAGMLPNMLAADAVDSRLVRGIARRIARFHAHAATGAGVDEHGSLVTVRANWEENFAQMAPFVDRILPAPLNQSIEAFVERFLTEQAAVLERRVVQGRIREGHGDLHAASICVVDGRLASSTVWSSTLASAAPMSPRRLHFWRWTSPISAVQTLRRSLSMRTSGRAAMARWSNSSISTGVIGHTYVARYVACACSSPVCGPPSSSVSVPRHKPTSTSLGPMPGVCRGRCSW
jgi:hypothetical protein